MLFNVERHKKYTQRNRHRTFISNDCSRSGLIPDNNLTVNKALTYDKQPKMKRNAQ